MTDGIAKWRQRDVVPRAGVRRQDDRGLRGSDDEWRRQRRGHATPPLSVQAAYGITGEWGDVILLWVGGVLWSTVMQKGIWGAFRSLLGCMTSSRTRGEGSALEGGVGNLRLPHSMDGIFSQYVGLSPAGLQFFSHVINWQGFFWRISAMLMYAVLKQMPLLNGIVLSNDCTLVL